MTLNNSALSSISKYLVNAKETPYKISIFYKDSIIKKMLFFYHKPWFRKYFLKITYANHADTVHSIDLLEKERIKPLLGSINKQLKKHKKTSHF